MAEKVELELILKGGAKSVKTLAELEEGLAQARKEIKGLDKDSARFKELATAIQQASSEVKTLEKQMEGLEPQQKAEAFLKMGEGIAGGFAAAQGAMGLMGVESEDLEKIQVKVQSAIAIAQGVRMMSEAALMATTAKRVAAEKLAIVQSKLGIVVTKGQAIATGIAATAQGVWNRTIALTTVGLKALKIAIAATGIGALVLAIVAIGVAVYEWATATDKTALAQANLNKELVKNNNEFIKNRDLQKQLSQANTQAEKDLVKLQNTLNKNTENLKTNSDGLNANAESLKNLGDKSKEEQKIIKNNSKILAKNSTTIQGNITALDNLIKKKQEEIAQAEEEEETAKQNEADRKQRSSERRSRRKTEAAELLQLEQELFLMRIEDENERAQAKIELDKQNALEGAIGQEEQIKLIKEKYRLLEEERKQALEDIEFEKLIAKNDKFNEENLKSQEELLAKETAAKEKEAAKQLELDAKVAAFKEGLGNQLFGLAKELGGKNEKLQKSLAIAETAFFTGKSIMRALADIPAPYGVIQAGIHGAMGIAQIANIKSEQIGVDEPDTPDTIIPATTGAFSLGGGLPEQQAVKAYVVTDEMSDSQAQLSDIRRRSTI